MVATVQGQSSQQSNQPVTTSAGLDTSSALLQFSEAQCTQLLQMLHQTLQTSNNSQAK